MAALVAGTTVVLAAACAAPGRSALPAGADRPSVGPEIVVAARPIDEEEDPVPSWDGERYLVVWQTTRSGPTDIYGAWIAPDGTVTAPDGRQISHGSSDELFPDVTWGGESHLVVWQDLRSRRNWEIYGNRVTRAGVVRDSQDIAIGGGPSNHRHPRVAWGGGVFLVVWTEERPGSGWDVAAARVGPDGVVLDPGGITVGAGPGDQTRPAVAWNGEAFVIVWMDDRRGESDILAARLDPSGRLLDQAPIEVSAAPGEQSYPAVAARRDEAVVIWVDRRAAGPFALYGARLAADGRVLDPEGVPLSTAPRLHMFPAVACGERECLVLWEEEHESAAPMTRITDVVRDVLALWWDSPRVGRPFAVAPDALGNHFTTVATDGRH
ncbi:MAG: hypothetical protein HY207_08140, partial [Nitrospirae bacterium]|nr:hypothetical protein [Nitrospirota bacterium]